jgi:hypothetical protein
LEPINVPEENRPKPGATSVPRKVAVAEPVEGREPKIPLSHYKANFESQKH